MTVVGKQPDRHLAPLAVQKVDITIHRISDYPLDNAISFPNTYPLVMIYLAAVVQKADSAIPG